MATHSSTLGWRIPWRGEPGRLQSMGSQRVRHDWMTSLYRTGNYIQYLAKVKVTQSCPTLGKPMNYTVHGILQARILEWIAFPFSRGSSQPRDRTQVSCIAGGFFTIWATREVQEYWSGYSIPSPVDHPNPGIEPRSPPLQADSLATELSCNIP